MILLNIFLIVFLALVLLIVLTLILEPASLAIFYSLILRLFVKNSPIVDVDKFMPHAKILRDNWQTIRQELDDLLREHMEDIPVFHKVDAMQTYISAYDKVPWRSFMIKAYDQWFEDQIKLIPKTKALLEQVPELRTVMFSILEPGKHIPYHRGFYKGIYRYHLALIVPKEGECYIINGGEKYSWTEGEDILFDDTYKHGVWNNTNETRVIVFADVLRNDMPDWLYRWNEKVFEIRAKSKRLKGALRRAKRNNYTAPKETGQPETVVDS